ncbi:MAG: dodecin family protein [Caldilineales bacterium]
MTIAKVIEVLAQSDEGWEQATNAALEEANRTLRNVKHIYIDNLQCDVENGQISKYRVNAKITFLVEN